MLYVILYATTVMGSEELLPGSGPGIQNVLPKTFNIFSQEHLIKIYMKLKTICNTFCRNRYSYLKKFGLRIL